MKILTQLKLENSILGVITQSFNSIKVFQLKNMSFDMCEIFQEYPVFCRFYYRNDREQNGAFTEMCETL